MLRTNFYTTSILDTFFIKIESYKRQLIVTEKRHRQRQQVAEQQVAEKKAPSTTHFSQTISYSAPQPLLTR